VTDLRERTLDAAVTLIEAEGLAALSMREVARRAGVSHQAPYHHFTDRQAILAAIAEEAFKRLNAALASAAGKSGSDAATRLVEAGRAYVEFAASNPAYFRVMFRPELVSLDNYPSARAEARRAFTALEALVKGAVKDNVIAPSLASWDSARRLGVCSGSLLALDRRTARKDGGRRPNGGRPSRIRAPRL
jgi:AcrR family transcriptional regulator